jgi:nitroreductase
MSTPAAPGAATLRALVARATLAPSTRNAQPWRWTVHPDHVDLELDEAVAQQLELNDPEGRELVMSCGAALLTLRVAAAEALLDARVDVLPDPHRPRLIACVTVEPGTIDAAFAELDAVIALRHTAWTAFDERPLPGGLPERLEAEAMVEGARLAEVPPGQRSALADLLRHADRERYDDPRRRDELARWVSSHWRDEGKVVPSVGVLPARGGSRRVDLGDRIAEHDAELAGGAPYVGVLTTAGDSPVHWVAAGQALQRVLLVAAEHQICGGFLNAPCQVEEDRDRLRRLLPGQGFPQVVLRLGYPAARPPGSARHSVDEVVTVAEPSPADLADVLPRDAGSDFTEDTLG